MIAIERFGERVDERERFHGTRDVTHRDRAVESDNGRVVEGEQQIVERHDLRPIRLGKRLRFHVQCGDRALGLTEPGLFFDAASSMSATASTISVRSQVDRSWSASVTSSSPT